MYKGDNPYCEVPFCLLSINSPSKSVIVLKNPHLCSEGEELNSKLLAGRPWLSIFYSVAQSKLVWWENKEPDKNSKGGGRRMSVDLPVCLRKFLKRKRIM